MPQSLHFGRGGKQVDKIRLALESLCGNETRPWMGGVARGDERSEGSPCSVAGKSWLVLVRLRAVEVDSDKDNWV